MKKWEKVLNRGGNFKMSMSTKVCSNHFAAGYCSSECRIPTLFLKGYNVPCSSKRSSPRKRLSETQSFLKSKRSRQVYSTGLDNSDNNIECSVTPPASKEHDYEVDTAGSCARLLPSITCQKCKEKNTTILELKQELAEEKNKLKDAMKKIEELQDANKRKNRFSIQEVKDSNRLVKFYTGLQNHGVFMWIYHRIQKKAKKLQYFRGDSSFTSKNYQTSENKKKSGKNPPLSIENCLFLTLIRLRVGLTETDLAFRFQVSQSLISRILATWISFLSQELSPLIYWPKKEDVLRYYPKCFKGYKNVIGIIDCTEGILEKPSIAKAQSQTYSAWKKYMEKIAMHNTCWNYMIHLQELWRGCI